MSNQQKIQELLKPTDCKSKQDVRKQIDQIDKELINLFTMRYEYVKAIVQFKEKNEQAIVDSERKEKVIKERSDWAKAQGLDPDTFARIFRLLIDHNIEKEMEIMEKSKEIHIG